MDSKNYLDDLSQIKDLMNRSSRFLSLSGLSGILAGTYALVAALYAQFNLLPKKESFLILESPNFRMLVILLMAVALLSLLSAYFLSRKKAVKNGEKLWDATTRRLLVNFFVPLLTGGAFILIQLGNQHYGLSASLMLLFYGLALVNASKYTLGHVQYLGYIEIVLGLICAAFPGYGIWFWMLGFGVAHIFYGTLVFFKEDRA